MRTAKALSLLWTAALGVSVRAKIMGIVLGLIFLLGIGATLQVREALSRALAEELDKRAISLAHDLAARSTDLILTNNTFALYELQRATLANNEDVRYAFIVDPGGHIVVHTFDRGFPRGLRQGQALPGEARYQLEILATEEGLIRDVAVPVLEGRAGTAHLGLTERRLHEVVAATTTQLLLTTVVVSLAGLLAAYLLTMVITKPITELAYVARAVGGGDLSRRANTWFRDEIGQLCDSFNSMTVGLEHSRREREEFSQQLVRRNRELSTLNEVATAVSGPLDLQKLLEAALGTVLDLMGMEAGWVLIREGDALGMVMQRGLPSAVAGDCGNSEGTCVCRRALRDGRPQLVHDERNPCPRLSTTKASRLVSQVCIPLQSKAHVLGVMNLAASQHRELGDEEISLLGVIGNQIGVAIENSRLYEELQRKEELRGQLLVKVISAQEEERKRIARELHDQTSQSLTSFVVGLRVIEQASAIDEVHRQAMDLRALVATTLGEIHDLARELRPSVLDDLGLATAAQRYAKDYAAKTGINVDFEAVGFEEHRLAPEAETALYRVVQEALTNVVRHADARNVSVLLEHRASSVVAVVEDDGRGFDAREVMASPAEGNSLGLFGMRERANLIGGSLVIESRPGEGTSVIVQVPLEGSI